MNAEPARMMRDPEPEEGRPRRGVPWHQALGIPLNVLLFVLLMFIGWGSVSGFLAHPARAGVVVLLLLAMPVMAFSTSGRSRGVASVPDWRPFMPLLVMHSLATAYLMPYMDARSIWVLPGGDLLRWAGLAIFVVATFFRVGPMLALGRRFSAKVAVQEGHRLTTTGFYAAVRHPSYLGILLMDLAFPLLFRSSVGIALLPVAFWMFKRRMDVEEDFMRRHFGGEYDAYAKRTARLIPGLY